MKSITIALAGQPNVGKSMLINSIGNSHLRVGNFSGVTVEKAEVFFVSNGYSIRIIDLPGSYSLSDYTIEEKITKDFLIKESYDLVLNVVDSTNLERNLYLTSELLELGKKMVIALNMSDEAKKEEISIDSKKLSEILGVDCLMVSAATKEGIDELIKLCIKTYEEDKRASKLVFSDEVEEEIGAVAEFLKEKNFSLDGYNHRLLAIKLLKEDKVIYKKLHADPIWIELVDVIKNSLSHLYLHHDTKSIEEVFSQEKASFARGISTEVLKLPKTMKKSITEKIDNILIHKFFGLPIFLFLMWGLFQLTFTLGEIPKTYIETFFEFLSEGFVNIFGEGQASSLFSDGIIAGVGAVASFLPDIIILFFGITLLETTGYMARVAFLLDGFFHKFGLHGKSFIPLVTGFGCSVPAYMATRTLKNEKDRLITLFIIGFMSCSAKLPIYVLFAGAFFPASSAGNVLFLIYISGAVLGLIAAKALKVFVFKGHDEPFVMEMPKYRLPSLKLLWHTVMGKAWMYLRKAGTFILAASVLIWFASVYPKNPVLEEEFAQKIEQANSEDEAAELQNELDNILLKQSYLGRIGQLTNPIFKPLGFDWKMTVALETGLAAKEVVVSTLGVLYSLGADVDESNENLASILRENISLPSAVAFIVFSMIYLPCLAATVVFTKESGSYKYLFYLVLFTTITAWVLAFIAFHVTSFFV